MTTEHLALAVLVLVAVWIGLLAVASSRQRDKIGRGVAVTLEGSGLALTGDPFAQHRLEGTVGDTRITVHHRVPRPRPGAREDDTSPTVCFVELELNVPDLIVCQIKEVDRVMGPLPAVSRTRTGHAAFDEAFAVFASTSAAESGSSYRGAPVIPSIAWARASVVERLVELGLLWIRVRDQRCEVAFEPSGPEDEVRAARTSVNLARAVAGAPLLPVDEGSRTSVRESSSPVVVALVGAVAGLFLGFAVGSPAAYLLDLPPTETVLWFIAGTSVPGCAIATMALAHVRRSLGISAGPKGSKKVAS